MPDQEISLSQRENHQIKNYAQAEGITEEDALKQLALENIRGRLKATRKPGVVKAFKSLKTP